MKKTSIEMAVGVFMLIGIACVGYLTIQLGKMQWIGDNFYALDARFKSAAGLKTGSQVEIAGVQVGQVDAIRFDQARQMAMVRLKIQKNIVLTDDVIASVKTSRADRGPLYQTDPGRIGAGAETRRPDY